MPDIHADRVLILDFGAQYTQLIARRIREIGVYSEIYACDVPISEIKAFAPKAIVLSGGPESVYDAKGLEAPSEVYSLGVPVLGICYGMQTMAAQLGGQVEGSSHREFGAAQVRPTNASPLLDGLEDNRDAQGRRLLDVWMSHGDRVTALPPGFKAIAASDNAPLAAMADESRHLYGLQFHPEVTHSLQGGEILRRFVREIAGCGASWATRNIIEDSVARIRAQVGNDRVLLGLSGGVDSSVLAALLHQAIGTQLTCVFVDHGLLRLGEGDQVMATFAEHMGVQVIRVEAEQRFLQALAGEADQAVGIERVGRAGQPIEVEFQAHRGGGLGEALVELLRALEAAELGDAVLGAVDALARHVGIELEGMPGDGEAQVLLLQEVERALELALADIAPGTDHVGDDVDAANRLCLIHGVVLPYCATAYTRVESPATRRPLWKSQNTALR